MELHNLKPAANSVKSQKRIARGPGSGHGGTATRGHKGAKSRAGYHTKRNYEGGQTPLQMRLPKRGFKNPFRVEYEPFNIERLVKIAEKYSISVITPEFLIEKGYIRKYELVKILADGDLTIKLDVSAHKFSKNAVTAIEQAGGTVTKM
ncbi:MAG TPA: 50S ribosomal protein L15 [Saprospirales bacterium]|nr:50S ribosomal protein L15 [Saprospirales bacterium]HAY70471.1 50S ribosomal protein L15 [Saprospirales bacterium]HRQ28456.1 50S ribosomal protein L15 [Saprospiraceae bacterium]